MFLSTFYVGGYSEALFAIICCSCIAYYIYGTDSPPKESKSSEKLSIYEVVFASNKFNSPTENSSPETIINYSIYHKLYSIYCTTVEPHDIIELIKPYTDSYVNNKLIKKIIFAELRGTYGKEDVTTLVRSAQGLKCDFHKEIMDQLPNGNKLLWDNILYEYDLDSWDILTLVDSFGHIHNIHMDGDRCVNWSPDFILG